MSELLLRLWPEQREHEHREVKVLDLRQCTFVCAGEDGCGAVLVIPELAETYRDELATVADMEER